MALIWLLDVSQFHSAPGNKTQQSNQNRKQRKTEQKHTLNDGLSPFPPKSDQDRSSPYNTNAIPRKKVVRIKKNIHKDITS